MVKMHDGSDKRFLLACKNATEATGKEIKPTARQFKKWQRREGSAYAHRNGHVVVVE